MSVKRSIKLFGPAVSSREVAAVAKVLKSGWWGLGPVTAQFEEAFAQFVGVKYAVGVNSCTAALHLALRVLPHKGEVIVPALSFVSTALVGLYERQKVVFADIDEETLCLDQQKVIEKISPKTTAVIPMHYGGRLAEMSYKSRIDVIEDCAHAVGTEGAGQSGRFACWSFHPVKNLATGDAGMITTNEKELYERFKVLRWVGIDSSTWARNQKGYNWEYSVNEVGFKYHTNDIMSALGLVQLQRINFLIKRRRQIANIYKKELAGLPLRLPPDSGGWHLFVIRVDRKYRNRLVDFLKGKGIAASVHYKPLYYYPIFDKDLGKMRRELPVTEKVWQEIISLPIYSDLTRAQQETIIRHIRHFLGD